MIKRARHSPEEIATKLSRASAMAARGIPQTKICKRLGISVMTLHRWRRRVGKSATGVTVPIESKIAALQAENFRLRETVINLKLEIEALREPKS